MSIKEARRGGGGMRKAENKGKERKQRGEEAKQYEKYKE